MYRFSSSLNATSSKFAWVCLIFIAALSLCPAQTYAQIRWARSVASTDADRGYGVASDGAGGAFVSGYFSGSADFDGDGAADLTSAGDYDAFLARYDADGNLLYARRIGAANVDIGSELATDGAGGAFLTGQFWGAADFDGDGAADLTSAGDHDIFLARYDADGNLLYAQRIGGTAWDVGYGAAADGSGGALLTGIFSGLADFDGDGAADLSSAGKHDAFLARYDADGNLLYARRIGSPSSDRGYGVASDGAGGAFVSGYFSGSVALSGTNLTSAGRTDGFLARYDTDGNLLYARRFGGASSDVGYGVATDGSGGAFVTGLFEGSADFDDDGAADLASTGDFDGFLAHYDPNGDFLYARRFGSTSSDYGTGITGNGSGGAFVTGHFSGSADFDDDGTADLTSAGRADAFLAHYDADGDLLYARRFGGSTWDFSSGLATDGSGGAFLVGFFSGSVDFDGDGAADLTSAGDYDAFLARYDAVTLPVELADFTAAVRGTDVHLHWHTASEVNNSGFEVQHRYGAAYRTVAFVEGAGTAAEPQRYAYRVPRLEAGTHTFRLKQVDYDGHFDYSSEVEVIVAPRERLTLAASGGLAEPATLRFTALEATAVHLALYDVLGRRVRVLFDGVAATGQAQQVIVDSDGLPAGLYFARLTGAGQVVVQRVMVAP